MTNIFAWGFLTLAGLGILTAFLYDTVRCKHEWEHRDVKVYDKNRGIANALVLICKKCGKVKVIK